MSFQEQAAHMKQAEEEEVSRVPNCDLCLAGVGRRFPLMVLTALEKDLVT